MCIANEAGIVMREILKRKNFSKRFYSLFILYILLFSKDTLLFGTNSNENTKILGYVLTFFVCLLLLAYCCKNEIQFEKKSIIFAVIFIILSLLTMIVNFDISIKYFYEVMAFIIALTAAQVMSFYVFKKYFYRITIILAAFSLITYFISILYYPLMNIFPTVTNVNGYKYYFCIFSIVAYNEPYVFNRNYGFAREPGVFGIYLVLAFLFLIISKDESFKFKIIGSAILIITIITTFSTAAYICIFLAVIYYLLFIKNNKLHIKFIISLLFLLLSFAIYNNSYISKIVFGKIHTENSSSDARMNAIIVNIFILFSSVKNILIGCGYSFSEENFVFISKAIEFYTNANTNTVLKQMAIHGILFGLLYTVTLFVFLYKTLSQKKMLKAMALFLILLMLLSNEDLSFNLLIFCFIFYGISSKRRGYESI